MLTEVQKQEFYQALLDKNVQYEGVFFVGVQTTGVFCCPTCPARKPKLQTVNSIEQLRKHFWHLLGYVCATVPFLIQTKYRI